MWSAWVALSVERRAEHSDQHCLCLLNGPGDGAASDAWAVVIEYVCGREHQDPQVVSEPALNSAG